MRDVILKKTNARLWHPPGQTLRTSRTPTATDEPLFFFSAFAHLFFVRFAGREWKRNLQKNLLVKRPRLHGKSRGENASMSDLQR
mmetsp:Transcript_3701/g.23202  ORF Transcript_3701/g.23202 Transcript_3701/m.23202 type:complete len:85 (-) Transcript_3701:781-1035(-)